jgi:hypothetical protein
MASTAFFLTFQSELLENQYTDNFQKGISDDGR